jgi:hypothetical protein
MTWTPLATETYLKVGTLKHELAQLLDWPFLENLTFFQVWPGGWCLLGRPARMTLSEGQRSMNFELGSTSITAEKALMLAIQKVKAHPERLEEKVRWFCPEHEWEAIIPRGEMHSGCPQCGAYFCEPYPKPELGGEE